MIGQLLSHYRIVEKLGQGGMGAVYKAEDMKLERTVAIKVLAPELASRADTRERFVREAKSAAALNHPNICSIYEIGEAEEKLFIVMELVEGCTVKERLLSGPLTMTELVSISLQAAAGLRAAHERGILHRDIKTSNLMLTPDHRVKILDFGLARLDEGSELTRSGMMLGTPAYMSPEQARGEAVDKRSDLWSFGVVLYEMATARLPFGAGTAQALYAILHKDPPPLRSLRPEIPSRLEALIQKALAKDPATRWQRIEDMIVDLELLREGPSTAFPPRLESPGASPPSSFHSVAVLPFVNMGPDREDDYFSDGLTEEIINALTQIRELRVVSRASVFQFKGMSQDIREVGSKLRVEAIVLGSLRKVGNRLRIGAQLVYAENGYQIWSDRFDREMKDLFDLQDDLTQAIVAELRIRLVGESQRAVLKRRTDNVEAHDLYLRGRYFFNLQTEQTLDKAMGLFEQASKLSSGYALPLVGLADCYTALAWYGLQPPNDVMPRAKVALKAALRIDGTEAAAHCLMATVRARYDWDWELASKEFQKTLILGPGFATSHFHYALDYLTPLGRLDEALEEIRVAQELDPLSLLISTALGGCLYRQRRYDAAIAQLQATLEMNTDFYHAHWTLARAYEQCGLFAEAVSSFHRTMEIAGRSPSILAELGHCQGLRGESAAARGILAELRQIRERRYVSRMCDVFVYLGLGETRAALDSLEQAFAERAGPLVWIKVDPRFDRLRSQQRLSEVVGRLFAPKETSRVTDP